MRYLGGKDRIAPVLGAFLTRQLGSASIYAEPFCGGLSVASKVQCEIKLLNDIQPSLLSLYRSLAAGWQPPEILTEAEYLGLKAANDPDNPLTAFAAFGCSFSGKFWGGYARDNTDRNYAGNARSSLLKKMEGLRGARFSSLDYREFINSLPVGTMVYCDPPYAGTTEYKGATNFDSAAMWEFLKGHAARLDIFVSEYQSPGFPCVWEWERNLEMHSNTGNGKRVERLFKII